MAGDGDQIVIHRGGSECLDALEPLWHSLHYHHADVAPELGAIRSAEDSWKTRRAEYQNWLAASSTFILVAQLDGKAIGYAFVQIADGESATWEVPAKVGVVETLSILPEYRGSGLGAMLLERVYAELRQEQIEEVSLGVISNNQDAIRFYERQGFAPRIQYMAKRLSES